MERILVTGGSGLLAHALKGIKPPDFEIIFLNHLDFDLLNPKLMERRLTELQPQLVINTAAYNLVDLCEQERSLSWAINAVAPGTLANFCVQKNMRLIHYSTDYVFDGTKKKPYFESDLPNPLNHYAAGKFFGEQAVLKASSRHLVIRTSWVFGFHPTQTKTFIHSVLKNVGEGRKLKSTTDQVSVPTFAPDLAEWTLELTRLGMSGLVHAVNDESVSRFDWTKIILEEAVKAKLISDIPPVDPVLSSYFNSTMRRADYTVLSNVKLTRLLGHTLGSWRVGLRKMLAQMK